MIDCPLYRAEDRAWARCPVFRSVVPSPQAFVTYVCQDYLFRSICDRMDVKHGYETVLVGDRGTISKADVKHRHITLAPGHAPTHGLLLHEIAHLCTPGDAYHDHRYCANYLSLVRRWLGSAAAEVLLFEMRAEGAFA